jgi:hypothetical protein
MVYSVSQIRSALDRNSDEVQRLNLIFRDPNKHLLRAMLLVGRILTTRKQDRRIIVYMDFLPLAEK